MNLRHIPDWIMLRVMRVYEYYRREQMYSPEDSRLMAQEYLRVMRQRYSL